MLVVRLSVDLFSPSFCEESTKSFSQSSKVTRQGVFYSSENDGTEIQAEA
jgi:hypothetical protein